MKKYIILTIIFLIPFSTISSLEVTIYADDGYPPYSYVENDELKGIYTEIMQLAFSQMQEYEITLEGVPWKRGLDLLNKGKGFGLYPPYFLPKARPYIEYSVPILKEEVVVIGRKEIMEGFDRFRWPEDFYGLTVIQNDGFDIGGDDYNLAVKYGLLFEIRAKNNRSSILMLGLGRADVYINDRLSILFELNNLKNLGIYDEGGDHTVLIEGPVISSQWGYLGITNRDKGHFGFKREFVFEFNEIITKMKENGEIENIVKKYLMQSYK